MEDGVRTFVIVNACCVSCAIVAPVIVMVSVRGALENDAVALGAPDDGAVKVIAGVSKPHIDCNPAPRSGMVRTIFPPCKICPAVVNVTVASSSTPGVSVAVANVVAPVKTPAEMVSVSMVVGPSITLRLLSLVVRMTFRGPTTDDGVRVLVMLNTYCVCCDRVPLASVNDRARVLELNATFDAVGSPLLAGSAEMNVTAFGDSKRHCSCVKFP